VSLIVILIQKNVTRKQRNWERRLEVKRRKRKEEKQRKKLNRLNKGDLTLINISYLTGSNLCTFPCPIINASLYIYIIKMNINVK